jgi:hypothetical protein
MLGKLTAVMEPGTPPRFRRDEVERLASEFEAARKAK